MCSPAAPPHPPRGLDEEENATRRLLLATIVAAALTGCADLERSPGGEPVATQTIAIPGLWVFEPAHAQVKAGEPVTFRNDGGADHTVTFEDIDFDVNIKPGGSATYTFNEPGTYEYTCKYHPPDMRGTIIVIAATPSP